ncbi:MAG: alpha/beta hydrolase [Maricaulaceae bacterium]|jgi:hypothetical protein
MSSRTWSTGLAAGCAAIAASGCAMMQTEPVMLAGQECARPPVLHCPETDCPGEVVTDGGPVVEPTTGRNYFLDYPCDLRPGEDVTLILSLHGGGSYGNWQRHYFPILDYVDSHRLVIATPNTRGWSSADDEYLQNIVSELIDEIGAENVSSFWLAGHSMGSFNSRRLVCTDFFADKADGYLSLSGGRVGNPPDLQQPAFNIPPTNGSDPNARRGPGAGGPPPGAGGPPPGGGGGGPFSAIARAEAANLECGFSFIYAGGGHEPSAIALPETSSYADANGCEPRVIREEVVDTEPGYVYDSSRQEFGTDAWGRLPRGGTAVVMEYPNCDDGRIVADVVRQNKGHTEGLEPNVTRTLVELMQSAPGGKLRENAG